MAWKTLEGEPIDDVYDAIREDVRKVMVDGGSAIAYIGTDGQNIGQKYTSFVQCIAIHMFNNCGVGKGGRVYYVKHLEKRYQNRSQRLLREVEISVKLAQKMEPLFTELGLYFEVHVDVNSDAGKNNENKSHEVHDTAKGWIESMGWMCKTKPQAFVASIVADRHTKTLRNKTIKPWSRKSKSRS